MTRCVNIPAEVDLFQLLVLQFSYLGVSEERKPSFIPSVFLLLYYFVCKNPIRYIKIRSYDMGNSKGVNIYEILFV